jgi:3-isopropylmalate dehydrogenase
MMLDNPDLEVDCALTDAMSVYMIERLDALDVVASENFVGDLLPAIGAAEIGNVHGCFHASHGTVPDIAGKGIAEPSATIVSGACMLK